MFWRGRGSLGLPGRSGGSAGGRLPADRYLPSAQPYSRAISGTLGGGDPPRVPGALPSSWAPGGSSPASGISLPPCPPGMFGEESAMWFRGGRRGASPGSWTPEAGQAGWGAKQAGLWASRKGADGWGGHCFSGGPAPPKLQSCLRPRGPPPCGPAPGAASSPLGPPGPWHGRVCPPHNHIWFSLGPRDASAPGPPLLGEVGRRD